MPQEFFFLIYNLYYTPVHHIYAIDRIKEYTQKSYRRCRKGVANVVRNFFQNYTLLQPIRLRHR